MGRAESRRKPAEVTALRERIEQWRRTRKSGDAMPAQLWAAAVGLAGGQYTVFEVARLLKVDYGALKRRVVKAVEVDTRSAEPEPMPVARAASPGETPGLEGVARDEDDAEAIRFIEMSGASLFGQSLTNERVVELVHADGSRMTIRQPAEVELDVVGLTASFWRCGT